MVRLIDKKNHFWGQALYSNQSQIALRFLTREERPFDAAFLTERIRAAAAFRQQVAPGRRLIGWWLRKAICFPPSSSTATAIASSFKPSARGWTA